MNGSSAKWCRIPAPLFLNEGVTLSLFFSVVPVLVLCRPLVLRTRQDFPLGEQKQERKGGVDGCVAEKARNSYFFSLVTFQSPILVL